MTLPGLRTTHDWSADVDVAHVESIRRDAERLGSGGATHLVLEVIEYALDEAREGATSEVQVVLHADGSVAVVDDGRGTDTRLDANGVPMVKPVMATRDLRFFGQGDAPVLPDGRARHGMSVVTSLSSWLVHTNRRAPGGWSRRYENGLPAGAPATVEPDGSTGTSVRFLPDPSLVDPVIDLALLREAVAAAPVPVVLSEA